MSNRHDYKDRMVGSRGVADSAIDAGLRAYMTKVYNLMALGLVITGVVSFLVISLAVDSTASARGIVLTSFGVALYNSPLMWVIFFAPLVAVIFLQVRIHSLSAYAATMAFLLFSAIMGLSLSSVFLVYTGKSVTQTFFVTAAAFSSLSLYGYVTKRNLDSLGSFMFMGFVGILLSSIVNIFLRSSALGFTISVIGVIVFAGLTAYDTQKIKESYSEHCCEDVIGRQSVMSALSLYMDFINMFLFLLRLMGQRRD
ncbi:MAG: hypothetical protein C4617_00575 [Candidatus Liberibacter europaeus]|uniref:BAX inhibitor (BI)-1/YccA family protein n=1 Tax=Candidatus Liberibacter europaeus TaxID=744859 RepID=A0A2T4VYT5_9HYPH|nr:hypothetical protein [Candidatus Liberibacter europaeus]PTL86949.1 MAG: hypothetical protein C4617_00575 [Candidatus Liberibacter europaeus]